VSLLDEARQEAEDCHGGVSDLDARRDCFYSKIVKALEAAEQFMGLQVYRNVLRVGPPHRPECPHAGMWSEDTPECTCGLHALVAALKGELA
jgi:hypothetical protein